MIPCPHCNHLNRPTAAQCESCLTPLTALHCCPNCGAPAAADARFCGQCGFNLQTIARPGTAPAFTPLIPSLNPDDGGAAAMPTLNLNALGDDVPLSFTALQSTIAYLCHLQTQTRIDLPLGKSVIHIGKPNDRIPPDIDVAGFQHSEIVSRIHADIRIEGDFYYVEDIGSSNGTYVNGTSLGVGSRYRLRSGDRISLGKGEKITFQFYLTDDKTGAVQS